MRNKRRPVGFHSEGSGADRKVIPHFAPSGHAGRHSSFVHPSREQVHQVRIKKQQVGGVTKRLTNEGFADKGIVSNINRINAAGFKTVASCSGLRRDHPMYAKDLKYRGDQTYLSIEMPEDVVQPGFSNSIHDVEPSRIKKPEYVQRVMNAVHRANWNAELSLYLMFIPTVRASPPVTHFVQTDADAETEPNVVAAQKALDKTMTSEHNMDEFNKALEIRDRVREQAYIRHGGRVNRSDAELDKAWERLTFELEQEGFRKMPNIATATSTQPRSRLILNTDGQLSLGMSKPLKHKEDTNIVIWNNGTKIGSISMRPEGNVLYLSDMEIHTDYRRKGYGARAVSLLERSLKTYGFTRIEVEDRTILDDMHHSFWRQQGYVGPKNNVFVHKDLTAGSSS